MFVIAATQIASVYEDVNLRVFGVGVLVVGGVGNADSGLIFMIVDLREYLYPFQ